jgi:outer membrane immunogenic protein
MVMAFLAACVSGGAGFAADWPLAAPQLYRAVPAMAVEWTGLYFGANAGYGWAHGSTDTSFEGGFSGGTTTLLGLGPTELSGTTLGGSGKPSGAIAGGQVGFNWQAGMLVFGAEADGQWSGQQSSFTVVCSGGCTATENVKIRSLATGRARVGLAFDWILPYLTAGAALVNIDDDLTVTAGGVTGSFRTRSGSTLGWTAGAGVDFALSSNWSARLEYLYVSADDHSGTVDIPNLLGFGTASVNGSFQDNIVRAGLNYRFGPRGGPGVLERTPAAPASYASTYDFLPSIAMFADQAGTKKRAPAAPIVVETPAQRPAPPAVASETRPVVASAAVATEPRPATLAAAATEPKQTESAVRNFDEIEDTNFTDGLEANAKLITLPSTKERKKAGDDGYRLKRIMAICSGC